VLRQHADDRVGIAIEGEALPDHTLIAAEASLPQAIAQHDDARFVWIIIRGDQGPPRGRLDAEHLKGVG